MRFRTFALASGVIVAAVVAFAGIGIHAQTQSFRMSWVTPTSRGSIDVLGRGKMLQSTIGNQQSTTIQQSQIVTSEMAGRSSWL